MGAPVEILALLGRSRRVPGVTASSSGLDALYRRTFKQVLSLLKRRGIAREADRRDIAQDVYLIAHQKMSALDPKVSRVGWILRTADLEARNQRRKPQEQPYDEEHMMTPAPHSDPETSTLHLAWYREITRGIDPDQLLVFELHELYGSTIAEIALVMERPESTVRTWLANVLEKLTTRAASDRRQGDTPFALLPFGVGAWRGVFDVEPGPGEEEELWGRICREIVSRGAAGAATVGASKAALSASFVGGTAAGVGGTLLVLHLLGGWIAPRGATNDSAPILAAEGMVPAPSGSASALSSSAAPLAAASLSVAPPPSARPAPGLDPDEMRLIQQAHAAHTRGDVHAAQHAIDEHARRFPNGSFRKDRESVQRLINERRGIPSDAPDAGRQRIFGDDE